MIYLLTNNLNYRVIYSFHTLKKEGVPVKILMTDFDLRFFNDIKEAGLDENDIVNPYVLYGGFKNQKTIHFSLQDIGFNESYQLFGKADTLVVSKKDGKVRAKATYAARVVNEITYSDQNETVLRDEKFDSKGRLVQKNLFVAEKEPLQTEYLNHDGLPFLTISYGLSGENRRIENLIHLVDLDGFNQFYATQSEFLAAFIRTAVGKIGTDDQIVTLDSMWATKIIDKLPMAEKGHVVQNLFAQGARFEGTPLATILPKEELHPISEHDKALVGQWHFNDAQLISESQEAQQKLAQINAENDITKRSGLIKNALGSTGDDFGALGNVFFTFGKNIHVGEHFFSNFNVVFVDDAPITIGDNAKVGPNVQFLTAGHPINPIARTFGGKGISKPIRVGDNAWFGGGSIILPGVNLGDNVVVAAGAVVTKSFGSNVVLAGVPAKVIENIDSEKFDFGS